MKTLNLMKDYVLRHGYGIITNDNDHLVFRYQLENIHVIDARNKNNFLVLSLHGIIEVNDQNKDMVLMCCNYVNAWTKQVRVYVMNNDLVIVTEMYFQNKSNFSYQVRHALNNLVDTKTEFCKLSVK